jgi:hypothetical protein
LQMNETHILIRLLRMYVYSTELGIRLSFGKTSEFRGGGVEPLNPPPCGTPLLSSGLFPGVCSLNTNVSEHFVCSIFIGHTNNGQTECWHLNCRHRGITQKKAYCIQNIESLKSRMLKILSKCSPPNHTNGLGCAQHFSDKNYSAVV